MEFLKSSRLQKLQSADLGKSLFGDTFNRITLFRLLKHRDTVIPEFIEQALLELQRDGSFSRVAVEIIIFTALSSEALAVKASLADLERLVAFRRIVARQA
jgi:hypothetical protein